MCALSVVFCQRKLFESACWMFVAAHNVVGAAAVSAAALPASLDSTAHGDRGDEHHVTKLTFTLMPLRRPH